MANTAADLAAFQAVTARLISPASMSFGIKVTGVEDLISTFNKFGEAVKQKVRDQAQVKTSQEIVRTAKRLCPVDTGALRRSIRDRWSMKGKNRVRQVIAAAPYAVFVEYGRRKYQRMDAQPFLRPALYGAVVTYRLHLKDAIQAAMREAGKGAFMGIIKGSVGSLTAGIITASSSPKKLGFKVSKSKLKSLRSKIKRTTKKITKGLKKASARGIKRVQSATKRFSSKAIKDFTRKSKLFNIATAKSVKTITAAKGSGGGSSAKKRKKRK